MKRFLSAAAVASVAAIGLLGFGSTAIAAPDSVVVLAPVATMQTVVKIPVMALTATAETPPAPTPTVPALPAPTYAVDSTGIGILGLCNYSGEHINLFYGSSGEEVVHLQCLLRNYHGYTSVAVDGNFGTYTRNAVRHFQSLNGLAVDGWVGQNTWNALHPY